MSAAVASPTIGERWPWYLPSLAIVVVAVALQAYLARNPDTSWLLFVAQRTLDGAVPYRDILETNPPASFLLYLPAVALARLVGASAIAVTDALVVLATALSLALCGVILARAALLARSRAAAMLFAASLILLVMPLSSFAQREHIAVLASLPILAALSARSQGRSLHPIEAVLAGLGAGIAIAIKPVFAFAFAGPLICCLMAPARPWPWRFAELWVAAAAVLAYGAVVILLYPDFANRVLPLVVDIYIPARLDLITLFLMPPFLIWMMLAGSFWWIGWSTDPVGRVLIAASIGFEVSVFVQGKGFAYHSYPAIALAALACMPAVLQSAAPMRSDRFRLPLATAPVLAVMVATLAIFDESFVVEDHLPGLTGAITAIAARPRMMTIGSNIVLGQAYAVDIGAEWVGSEPNTWITYFAIIMEPEHREPPRFAAAIDLERSRYAADIHDHRPDVILLDGEWWLGWIQRSPTLRAAAADYEIGGRFGRVILLKRRVDDPTRQTVSTAADDTTATPPGLLP